MPLWILALLLSAAVGGVAGCGKKHEPSAPASETLPPATVRVQKIEPVTQPVTEEVVGSVQPKLQAVIESKISGRITRLPVAVGQAVRQGDLLAQLDSQEIEARLEQAKATLRQTELEFQRTQNLRKQNAATQAEFDLVQARYNVAKAALAEGEAMSGYTKIAAPFDGTIARKLADEGDLAMPGKALLELEGRAGLRLVADVPGSLAARVASGASLPVRIDVLADPLTGTVAEISPAADPVSRTVRVKVDLPAAQRLRAGQFGRLSVPTSEGSVMLVPPAALVRRGQLDILFVASEGKAQLRLVRLGKEGAQGVEIISGLVPGESVVVEGAELLRDGQSLQTR